MKKQGKLFVVSGPSGAGKGTIIREMMKSRNDVKLSVSVTTRGPRNQEVHGVNYYFYTKEEFESLIEEGAFLEYAQVYDNYYGTLKQNVLDSLSVGENIILEIDIQGALQIKKAYSEAVFVFILPPSMAELKQRIIGRGSETSETLKKRFLSAFEEISYIEKYDYYIVNDILEGAVKSMDAIIEAESCRVQADVRELLAQYKEEI